MRYFFHFENHHYGADETGAELRDAHAAMLQAIGTMGEVLKDLPAQVLEGRALKLLVTDEEGRILFAVNVSTVIAPAVDPRPSRHS